LEYLKTDLAVSATGLLGVLFLQGSPAVSLRWERVTPPAPNGGGRPAASDSRQIPTVLWIDEASTRADIDEQLGPFIAMIAGSGKVKDPVLFHDQLLYRADQFQQYARAMEGAMGDQWWASGFRAELDVDVSGMVSPAVSVGGQLTIRFEWDRLTCTSAPRDPLPPGLQSLEDLVQAIAEDLDTVSQDVFTGTGYVPHGINVTLGVTGQGAFGVVNVAADAIGTVLFDNGVSSKAGPTRPVRRSPLSRIAYLRRHASESEIRYAREHDVLIESAGRDPGDVILNIARAAFRRGLEDASDMGLFFAQHAAKLSRGKWRIYELAVNFQLSVGGIFGILQIGGLANAELDLFNHNP
jgi:hypothetical protein